MKKVILSTIISAVAATGASSTYALEAGKLTIWMGGDKGYQGLQKVGDQFKADTGIEVKVEFPDDITGKFQQAAANAKGPDVMFWAHDRFGEWAVSGLLAEVTPGAKIQDEVSAFAWDAVTVNGKIYGYPISVEAIGLIYNKDLVPNPPKTFEEIFALDAELSKNGKKAILWDYNNTYFTWPLLAANGAYVFKDNTDPKDTGVNTAGALQGVELLKSFIDKGVMPAGSDYAAMSSGFNNGTVAMMISGPWEWNNAKKAKINYGVAPLPTVGGKPSKPMVGVLAGVINKSTPNKDLAVEFLENYVLTVAGLKTVDADKPLGAVPLKSYKSTVTDPDILATYKNAEIGVPMPNIPEIGKFWSAMGPALSNVTSGRQEPKAALDQAAKRILK